MTFYWAEKVHCVQQSAVIIINQKTQYLNNIWYVDCSYVSSRELPSNIYDKRLERMSILPQIIGLRETEQKSTFKMR